MDLDILNSVGCIISTEGFLLDSKFHLKELGVMFTYKNVWRKFRFSLGKFKDLNPKLQLCANWTTRNIHGMKYANHRGELASIKLLEILKALKKECDKEASKPIIGYRGGYLEKQILDTCSIPHLDLQLLGCPKFNELFSGQRFGVECKIHDHCNPNVVPHCPVVKCIYFKNWCMSHAL